MYVWGGGEGGMCVVYVRVCVVLCAHACVCGLCVCWGGRLCAFACVCVCSCMCTCVHVCAIKCVCVVIDCFYTNLAYQRSSDRWRSSASYISPRQHSADAAPFCPDHSSPSAEHAKQHCSFQHHTTWHFRWKQGKTETTLLIST